MWRGEFDAARTLADRATGLQREQPNIEKSWQLQLLICEIAISQLDTDSASRCLSRQPPADPSLTQLHGRREYLHAKAHVAAGKLQEALASLEAAQKLSPPGDETWLDAEILGGQVRLRLGEWENAEHRLSAVVRRAEETGDRHRRALALNNLGMGRLIRGRYDEAILRFEQVLSDAQLEQMAVYGSSLNNVGICYARLGQFDLAIKAQQRAVSIYERRGPARQLVEFLGSLGNTYLLSGDARSALPLLRRAMEAASAARLAEDSSLWARNLASAHADLGEWDDAERVNNEARRLAAASGSSAPVSLTLNAARIALGRRDWEGASRLFNEALIGGNDRPAIVWSAHAGLADVATFTDRPDIAAQHFKVALATIEKTRSNLLRADFRVSFLTQLIEFYQRYVDALVDGGRSGQALEITESSRGRVLAERHGVESRPRISVDALRSLSQQSGTVFLSYWLAPRRSLLWIVHPGGVRHVSLPPAGEIENLVRQHQSTIHNALANPLTQSDSAGERLYRLLVEPVASALTPGARVVIVPDGALHRLNFETLPVRSPSPHYWIEDVEIQIAPSLSLLTVRRETAPSRASMLLIGDASGREPEFPALRYASAEMANVAKHFAAADVTAHHKERAVPEAYRAAAVERFSLIHFTAHAVANTESPLDSAIMLSGPRESFKLYARDVADRPLNADLVTVSACRSAGERTYSGEGLVGFSWAFLRAGARRVIAGLWDVDDRSTADLMDRVYAAIARGMPPPQALRLAKLGALKSGGTYAKPYYWGPFEVFTVVVDQQQSKIGIRPTQAHLHAPAASARTHQVF